ncbi:hypothetical protein MYSTI_05651 [Myxococcus stipitatus DSM 14675]|uniref:Uncharacterized protein n=1 Tax=Myxococcus stipitatus (strain DSM 14675 / JCM 12634 / Mx s8) TaxID=1278073 RepID=L7UG06_MYXSD|nr:hypothetical protein [Myxococcus stipitatus]AGC46928.1 hypothetical protein MYSTI_05651 [Myxococcus stipitatus DSM 14675]
MNVFRRVWKVVPFGSTTPALFSMFLNSLAVFQVAHLGHFCRSAWRKASLPPVLDISSVDARPSNPRFSALGWIEDPRFLKIASTLRRSNITVTQGGVRFLGCFGSSFAVQYHSAVRCFAMYQRRKSRNESHVRAPAHKHRKVVNESPSANA